MLFPTSRIIKVFSRIGWLLGLEPLMVVMIAFPSKSCELAEYELADNEPLSSVLFRIFLVVPIMACTFHFGPKRRGGSVVPKSEILAGRSRIGINYVLDWLMHGSYRSILTIINYTRGS